MAEIRIRIDQPVVIVASIAALCGAAIAALYYNFVKANDFGVIIATIVGPVIAVQIQAWREERKVAIAAQQSKEGEIRFRQLAVFRQMMAHRSNPVDANFVQAYNIVPVDFQGIDAVTGAWKNYFAALDPNLPASAEVRNDRRAALLQEMATHLGYTFTLDELKRESYLAQGLADQMRINEETSRAMHSILLAVTSPQSNSTAAPSSFSFPTTNSQPTS